MNKKLLLLLFIVALIASTILILLTPVKPTPSEVVTPAPVSTSGCVVLTSDLSFGSRGSEGTKGQQLLGAENYPGGGRWVRTG